MLEFFSAATGTGSISSGLHSRGPFPRSRQCGERGLLANCYDGQPSLCFAVMPEAGLPAVARGGLLSPPSRRLRRAAFAPLRERRLVPVEGIEPPVLAEHDFESCASTSSATRALVSLYIRPRAAAILQPFSGDLIAKSVAKTQPVKLAAFEGQFQTEKGAPLRIGGLPDEAARETRHAIEIPYGLSLLAYGDPQSVVKGLNDFPPDVPPPVAIVHLSFHIMVA